MQQQQGNRPTSEEIARKVEQFVAQTPPEVVERMKQRLAKKRYLPPSMSGDLMTKRLG